METYNKVLADNKNTTMVHVSLDRSDDLAEKWAAKESFPWLTILPDDVKRSDLSEYHTTGSVPCYVLLDKDGEVVVAGSPGSAACFQKAAELDKKDKT